MLNSKRVHTGRGSRALLFAAVLALALGAAAPSFADENTSPSSAAAAGDPGVVNPEAAEKVLILGSTVSGGVNSKEALYATSLGYGVDVVTDIAWAALTAPEFAAYRGIVMGDPSCSSSLPAAALANVSTWVPVANGNVIVIGTDPVFHYSGNRGQVLLEKGIAFSLGQPGRVGLYLTLSCTGDVDPNQALPILNALSPGWNFVGAGCEDNIHIVATNPLLVGLTDAALSNWSCSVHGYATAWPSDFIPIALDTDAPPNFTSTDGFSGSPYVLGRGAGLALGNIVLTPESGAQNVGVDYDLVALVQEGGTAKPATTVTFTCTLPDAPAIVGTGVTGADGFATFRYTRTLAGVDTCTATFVNSKAVTETSNAVGVIWSGALTPKFTG